MILPCAVQIGDSLRNINTGGGLGILHRPEHPSSMTIADWAQSMKTCLALPIRKFNKVYNYLFAFTSYLFM